MKIQFIVTGWHFNQENTIQALYDLKEMNQDIIENIKNMMQCIKGMIK